MIHKIGIFLLILINLMFGRLNNCIAQPGDGSRLLSGNFSFNHTVFEYTEKGVESVKNTSTGFVAAPSFGGFITYRFYLGAVVNFNYTKTNYSQKSTVINKGTIIGGGFGLVTRVYHFFNPRFGLFGQADVMFNYGISRQEEVSGTNDPIKIATRDYLAYIRPGLVFMITPKLSIEATFGALGYSANILEPTDGNITRRKQKESNFGLLLNASAITFTVGYYFKHKDRPPKAVKSQKGNWED